MYMVMVGKSICYAWENGNTHAHNLRVRALSIEKHPTPRSYYCSQDGTVLLVWMAKEISAGAARSLRAGMAGVLRWIYLVSHFFRESDRSQSAGGRPS